MPAQQSAKVTGNGALHHDEIRLIQVRGGLGAVPGVRMAGEWYVTFCKTHYWVEAVASSLTELFAPSLMHERLAAFPKHYPWVDQAGLEYFRGRLVQAPRDSAQGLDIVTQHCTTSESQLRAFQALAFKIEMLWVLIDTIHHAYA